MNFDPLLSEHQYPALACGIHQHDSLMVAYLPPIEAPDEFLASDLILYGVEELVIDGVELNGGQRVKWWRVRNAVREHNLVSGYPRGLNLVEPIWNGPAGEFTTAAIPAVPRPTEKHVLHMRAYGHGPWIRLETAINENQATA